MLIELPGGVPILFIGSVGADRPASIRKAVEVMRVAVKAAPNLISAK
jgi:hypothetical protein